MALEKRNNRLDFVWIQITFQIKDFFKASFTLCDWVKIKKFISFSISSHCETRVNKIHRAKNVNGLALTDICALCVPSS